MTELVVVPGHAIYKFWMRDPRVEEAWYAEYSGEAELLVQHIIRGVELAGKDENRAILIFSGGSTMTAAGALAEGVSYWLAADSIGWKSEDGNSYPRVRQCAYPEFYARDSFENLLFSVLLFYRLERTLPTSITVAGWKFKRERIIHHAKTLGLEDCFHYEEVNEPPPSAKMYEEEEKTRKLFEKTPFGDNGDLLKKREHRDPFQHGGQENYGRELLELARNDLIIDVERDRLPLRFKFNHQKE